MIRTHVDKSRQLTIHKLIGKVTIEDLLAVIKKIYDKEPTPNNLWDLCDADISSIDSFDIEKLAQFPREYAPLRVGGKTALVASNDFVFGLSRMYEMYAENAGQNVQIQVFRSLEDARAWLDG